MAAVTGVTAVTQLICDNVREDDDCVFVRKIMHDVATHCMENATSNVDFSRDAHQQEYVGSNNINCERCKLGYFSQLFSKGTNQWHEQIQKNRIYCRTESRQKCKWNRKQIER